MKIYGVALLAGCYLIGKLMGDWLGILLGFGGNVGGVGFAMALLILVNTWLKDRKAIATQTEEGILFWSAMYIPIVVAMSATQNVKAAITGGWVAVLVGIFATLACFLLVPSISRIGKNSTSDQR
jgi:malonate transporter MadL subunit